MFLVLQNYNRDVNVEFYIIQMRSVIKFIRNGAQRHNNRNAYTF